MAGHDEWDEVPDEELEETTFERIMGLGEMFPNRLRNVVSGTINWSVWGVQGAISLARNGTWIIATTSVIMFMPYIIEKERADLERTQVAQQRQMLLGPSAAMQAAKQQ